MSYEVAPLAGPHLSPDIEIATYLRDGFAYTDMQFNIGRLHGHTRGADLINESGERVYVTTPSDPVAEEMIREALGEHSILPAREVTDDYATYSVPTGTRLLQRTFEAGPYAKPYMQSLALRSLRFILGLTELERNAFGITTASIALTHNGLNEEDSDDIHLTVVPPLVTSASEEILAESLSPHELAKTRHRVRLLGVVNGSARPDALFRRYEELLAKTTDADFDLEPMRQYFATEPEKEKDKS